MAFRALLIRFFKHGASFGSMTRRLVCCSVVAVCMLLTGSVAVRADEPVATELSRSFDKSAAIATYTNRIQPLLAVYCYGCHGEGAKEGGLELDAFADDDAVLADRQLWEKVLRKVRAGVMPPSGESRPNDARSASDRPVDQIRAVPDQSP